MKLAVILVALGVLLWTPSAQAHRITTCRTALSIASPAAAEKIDAGGNIFEDVRYHNPEVHVGPACLPTRHGYYIRFRGIRKDRLSNNTEQHCAGFIHVIHKKAFVNFHCSW